MRGHAAGLLCLVAAVELLIGHAVWLRRLDFVDEFVHVAGEITGEMLGSWVDWSAALVALDAGRLACSGSEAGMLRIAASLAEGVPVDLGEVVTGLDDRNLVLVAQAVLRAGGSGVAAVGAAAAGSGRR